MTLFGQIRVSEGNFERVIGTKEVLRARMLS